nr:thioesterase family protein [Nocardioides perillae]
MRWADMDMLGHVNNVTYVDYLQEARIDMLLTHAPDPAVGELAEGVVVVRHQVRYLAPLTFRLTPVHVEVWITEVRAGSFTMAYELFDHLPDGGRRVYLQATSLLTPYVFATEQPRRLRPEEREVLGRFLEPAPARGPLQVDPAGFDDPAGRLPLQVRFSDVDVYGHVNNVEYFTYFQEARVAYMAALAEEAGTSAAPGSVVLAQCDVDYRVPVLFRPEPYDVRSRVAHVGRTSFVIENDLRDGDRSLATARVVLVGFDATTQRAAPLVEDYRSLLSSKVLTMN